MKCVEPSGECRPIYSCTDCNDEAGAGLLDGCPADLYCRCAPDPLREESPIDIPDRDTRDTC